MFFSQPFLPQNLSAYRHVCSNWFVNFHLTLLLFILFSTFFITFDAIYYKIKFNWVACICFLFLMRFSFYLFAIYFFAQNIYHSHRTLPLFVHTSTLSHFWCLEVLNEIWLSCTYVCLDLCVISLSSFAIDVVCSKSLILSSNHDPICTLLLILLSLMLEITQ